jgi:predicted RNA-binding Zn ribbon-like protein
VEYLRRPADLADWLEAAGLVTGRAEVDDTLLADVRGLREAIDAGVRAAVTGVPFPAAALSELNAWLAAAPVQPPQLRLAGGVAVLHSPVSPRQPRQAVRRRFAGWTPPLVLDGGLR